MEQVYEPPVSVTWFQNELNSICRNRGIVLRIAWAPQLFIAKVIGKDGRERRYAKYPIRSIGSFIPYHVGNRFYRNVEGNLICVGYQKQGGLIPFHVLPSDIAQADIELVNHSQHYFVVERRLPDDEARMTHARKRRMAIEDSRIGFDLYGEFPPNGEVWEWCGNISAHYGVMQSSGVEKSCCEIAADDQVFCEGLFREPDQRDLGGVRAMLARWEAMPNRDNMASLIEQDARDSEAAIKKWEDEEFAKIRQEARENDVLDAIAQGRTRIVGGVNPPLHRTSY